MVGAIQRADLTLRGHGEHRLTGDGRVANHVAFKSKLVEVGLPAQALNHRRIRRRADDERAAAELVLPAGYGLAKDARERRGQFMADRLRGARLAVHHDLSDGAPVFFGRDFTRRCIAKPKPVAVFYGLGLRRRVTSDQSGHAGQTGRHEVSTGKFQRRRRGSIDGSQLPKSTVGEEKRRKQFASPFSCLFLSSERRGQECFRTLELHFHSQLHLTLDRAAQRAVRARQHRRNRADRRVADRRVRVGELRVIEQVERLDPDLGLDAADTGVLDQRGVDVERARARG